MKLFDARPYYNGAAGNEGRTYDVSPDGKRFMMIKPVNGGDQPSTPGIVLVQHFDEELKRLVSAK